MAAHYESLDLFAVEDAAPVFDERDARLVKAGQLDAFVRWASSAPEIVLDYETTGLHTYRGARPFAAGFYAPDKGAKVVDFRFTPNGERAVKDVLRARTGITIAHGAEFEVAHSAALGEEIGGQLWCNLAAAFAINENRPAGKNKGPLSQKTLVPALLGRTTPHATVISSWMSDRWGASKEAKRKWRYDKVPATLMVPYLCEDITDCWDLYQVLRPQVIRDEMLELVLTDGAFCRIIADMERTGLRLNLEHTEALHLKVIAAKQAAYRRFREAAGRDMDLGSHQALFGLLFGTFGLPMHADEEKQGKLDDDVLAWMLTLPEVKEHPERAIAIEAVRDFREAAMVDQTFLMPWMHEFQVNGRLHPNINPQGTKTRRCSSSNPNLQNIPVQGLWGPQVRTCFENEPGYTTYEFDYSQIQYRFFVHFCGEPALVEGYRNDPKFDMHGLVANELGIPRKKGKTLNLGILFGMGKGKLARSLLVSQTEAEEILERYYRRLKTIRDLKRDLKNVVKRRGYIRNPFGGRRHLTPDEHYMALNHLCQGSERDLIAKALTRIRPMLKAAGGDFMLMIHDSFKFRLPGSIEDHMPLLRDIKVAAEDWVRPDGRPMFRVPMPVDGKFYTTNWAETQEVPLVA